MKAYSVKILPSAWEDLAMIGEYYTIKFDKEAARKVTNQILDDAGKLEKTPERCSYINDYHLRNEGYRKMISGKYVIVFRVFDESVFIYHIAHMSTDYPKLF